MTARRRWMSYENSTATAPLQPLIRLRVHEPAVSLRGCPESRIMTELLDLMCHENHQHLLLIRDVELMADDVRQAGASLRHLLLQRIEIGA